RDRLEDVGEAKHHDHHASSAGNDRMNCVELIDTGSLDLVQPGLAIENRIGERHPATRRRRLRTFVDDDSVAGAEQSVGNSGPDVSSAPDETARHRKYLRLT